ncbi:MAG: BON domain-containing protein [Gammaproteobacteria bacterium]|nr:BON domain-containing protein [Gammaproteobacteria bacterium]
MKIFYPVNVLAAAIALVMMSTPVLADKMDDDIEAAAKNSHVFKTYLKDDDVKVEVEDGVATLSGTVHEDSHKSLAQETVASLPGVTSVDNKLDIEGEGPAEKSDEWLVAKVKTTLLFHKNVSALTEVSSKDGIVTLSGKADNQAQIELTTEYASDVEGVTEVENNMTVAASPENTRTLGDKIDDASITAAVKMVLLSHRSTSAVHTKVVTKDGVVTLSGEAKNDAEISLVTKLVSDTNGVNDVKNEMIVK